VVATNDVDSISADSPNWTLVCKEETEAQRPSRNHGLKNCYYIWSTYCTKKGKLRSQMDTCSRECECRPNPASTAANKVNNLQPVALGALPSSPESGTHDITALVATNDKNLSRPSYGWHVDCHDSHKSSSYPGTPETAICTTRWQTACDEAGKLTTSQIRCSRGCKCVQNQSPVANTLASNGNSPRRISTPPQSLVPSPRRSDVAANMAVNIVAYTPQDGPVGIEWDYWKWKIRCSDMNFLMKCFNSIRCDKDGKKFAKGESEGCWGACECFLELDHQRISQEAIDTGFDGRIASPSRECGGQC